MTRFFILLYIGFFVSISANAADGNAVSDNVCISLFDPSRALPKKPRTRRNVSKKSDIKATEDNGFRLKPSSLRQAYEMTALEKGIKERKLNASLVKRFVRFIKLLFVGRETVDHMDAKFGIEWQKHLASGDIVLDFTNLKDGELREITKWLIDNKKDFEDIALSISLVANYDLSTAAVLDLLNSGLTINYLDLHQTRLNTTKIAEAIVKNQSSIKEIVLDNVSDRDLVILSQLKNLQKLNINSTILSYSLFLKIRYIFNHALATLASGSSHSASYIRTRMASFSSFVTLTGIQSFINSQTRLVNGKPYNPHFRKLVLPKIKDKMQSKALLEKFVAYLVDGETPEQQNVNPNGIKLTVAGSMTEVVYLYAHDGDTFTGWDFDNNQSPESHFRMIGIDSFEISSTDKLEKRMAVAAKNFLDYQMNMADKIFIVWYGLSHQGRKLVDVIVQRKGKFTYVNQEMILNGLAIPYNIDSRNESNNRTANKDRLKVDPKKFYQTFQKNIEYWYSKNPLPADEE